VTVRTIVIGGVAADELEGGRLTSRQSKVKSALEKRAQMRRNLVICRANQDSDRCHHVYVDLFSEDLGSLVASRVADPEV
jgi:hypothetical protein